MPAIMADSSTKLIYNMKLTKIITLRERNYGV
jgi:hypothetical protein